MKLVSYSALSEDKKEYVKGQFYNTWQNSYLSDHFFNTFEEWIDCFHVRLNDSGKLPMRNALVATEAGKLKLEVKKLLHTQSYEVFSKQVTDKINLEVDKWFSAICKNNFAEFYLYFLPAGGFRYGNFCITENPPNDDWELASPKKLHGGMTKENAFSFVYTLVQRLSILPLAQ